MGYDMNLFVFKKKILDEIRNKFPEKSMYELYSQYLFTFLNPEEYEVSKEWEGRCICWENEEIFNDFFDREIDDEEAMIINEKIYKKMCQWLNKKLKTTTIYDIYTGKYDFHFMKACMYAYKNMNDAVIDFNNEFVLFVQDW